jgi:predicted nucleic acid-binding protein
MPAYYFDSSGIAKRYATEIGSGWVRSIVGEAENTVIIAEIGIVEVAAAFAKMQRKGRITIEKRDKYLRLFLRDTDKQYEVVPLNSGIIKAAINLTQKYKLRGYDAVQLATALTVNTELLRKRLPPLTFVAADEDLLKAAEAEGLVAENPNSYP